MELNIGIIGLGTVGSGVIESIEKNKKLILNGDIDFDSESWLENIIKQINNFIVNVSTN